MALPDDYKEPEWEDITLRVRKGGHGVEDCIEYKGQKFWLEGREDLSARVLAAKAAIKLLQENAELIEHAESLEMSFKIPIKGTPAKAKVTMNVEIIT